MTTSIPQLSEIEASVLDPLLVATGLQEAEQSVVKQQLGMIITMESIQKVLTSLPESDQKIYIDKLSALPPNEQLEHLQKYVVQNKKSQEILNEYFQNEVPQLIKELLTSFMEKATPDQKQRFLNAVESIGVG
ncbi:MAG: hypothetical protein WAU07_04240 [Microgenomates group bacterium]